MSVLRMIALVFGMSCAWSNAMAQQAMLMDLSGDVSVAVKGKTKKAQMADGLSTGVELRLSEQATAEVLLLSSATMVKLKGPGVYRIQPTKIDTLKGGAPQTDVSVSALTAQAKKFEPALKERMAMAAVVMRSAGEPKAPRLEGPIDVTVLTRQPQFWWDGKDASPATINVWNAEGQLIGQLPSALNGAHMTQALSPGDYEWNVEQAGVRSDRARFTVTDDENTPPALPESATFQDKLVRAMQLENDGHSYDAWMLWRQLAREYPDSAVLQKLSR